MNVYHPLLPFFIILIASLCNLRSINMGNGVSNSEIISIQKDIFCLRFYLLNIRFSMGKKLKKRMNISLKETFDFQFEFIYLIDATHS